MKFFLQDWQFKWLIAMMLLYDRMVRLIYGWMPLTKKNQLVENQSTVKRCEFMHCRLLLIYQSRLNSIWCKNCRGSFDHDIENMKVIEFVYYLNLIIAGFAHQANKLGTSKNKTQQINIPNQGLLQRDLRMAECSTEDLD